MDDLDKKMEFILELDKLKYINRQTYVADSSRKEDDAEHSWHLALMCMLLAGYSNEPVDKYKVMEMVLIHDVVEIDAGDTYAYDEKGNETKAIREQKAADRIFNILPPDQAEYCRQLWNEFEEKNTPEAKFANTLDKIQPIMLNDSSGGKAWREHKVKKSQIIKRNENTCLGSSKLWEYAKKLIDENVDKGNIINE